MDFSWILLALFLVAIIRGVTKALSKSMLRNILRLGSVIVAFLVAFMLQISGVFQTLVTSVLDFVNLAALLPLPEGVFDLIYGLASTVVGPLFFIFVFFPTLWILRIIIHFVVNAIEKVAAKKAANAPEEVDESDPSAEESAEAVMQNIEDEDLIEESKMSEATDEIPSISDEMPPIPDEMPPIPDEMPPIPDEMPPIPDENGENRAECAEGEAEIIESAEATEESDAAIAETPESPEAELQEAACAVTEEAPEAKPYEAPKVSTAPEAKPHEAPKAAAVAATVAPKAKPKKTKAKKTAKKAKKVNNKKTAFYREAGWKRVISLATGAISGLLLFAVVLMPTFYFMSIASTATEAVTTTDADDSQFYKITAVIDKYIIDPYEHSFVKGFYDSVGISDILNYTTKAGGKIDLENGTTVYADDVLKDLIANGLSTVAQLTSLKSECSSIKDNVNNIVSNPMVSSILSDVVMEFIANFEMEEASEDDLMGGLVYKFVDYYKNADKATIENDLLAIGDTVGVLAEEKILAKLMSGGSVEIGSLLEDSETLGNVVEAISGLSAFGPTIESAFGLGVEILGETLVIPADDGEAYEIFMDDILHSMTMNKDTKFDLSTVQYFVYHTERLGVKVNSSNGVKGYSQFKAYTTQWARVQAAFSHAAEDQSYGYFTMVINGNTYIYDSTEEVIVIYSEDNAELYEKYKDKVSPLAGLINALTLRSSTKQLTRDNLYAILEAYAASADDEVSVELANRILMKEGFTSKAVTIEKMLASTDFSDWTDEEKAKDSRLCVDVIMNLLDIMDKLGNLEGEGGTDAALDLLAQFEVLGETMDTMKQTSCANQLPPLLLEGIVKNEMLADFISPSIAYKINGIVEEQNGTYAQSMIQIAGVIDIAIKGFGGAINE